MNDFNDLVGELKQTRDELRVRAHLFKAEVKERWDELELKWEHLGNEVSPTVKATKMALSNINEANKLVLSEIKEGYQKIRKSMH